MATIRYVNVIIPEAERLSSLGGISHDLEACIASVRRLLADRLSDLVLSDALYTHALIRYACCFKGGIRVVKAADLTSSLSSEELTNHSFFLDYRDKHIAHSVNAFEYHQLSVWLSPEERGRGVSSVSLGSHYVMLPAADVLLRLQTLAEKMLRWVESEIATERLRFQTLVEERFSLDDLYSRETATPPEVALEDVARRRKPA